MKNSLLIAALSIFSIAQAQQIDRSVRPKAGAAPEVKIKESETFRTASGITVVLSENHKVPKVTFNLVMGSSPRIEGEKAGANGLMGQLLMSGTTTRAKDALDKEIDFIGASLSADGESVRLSCLTKHLDKGLQLMSDVTMNPSFPQSEVDRIIKQAESELLSAKSSPEQMAANCERKVNFGKHPNGNVMNDASLKAITRDDIMANYKETFTPNGAYLVIVGDISRADAEKMADKYFGKWAGEKVFKMDYGMGSAATSNRVIFVNKPGSVQSYIDITFPYDMKPGAKEQLALEVMNNILGGPTFGSRIMQNLREDKAYTYGAYASASTTRNGSWYNIEGSFRNEVTDSAITQLLAEVTRITESYVTDEELNLIKASMAGQFSIRLENPSTVANFALNIIRNNLPSDYYQNYLKRLNAITKEDILMVAQKYLTGGKNIIVVGNEEVLSKIAVFDTDGKVEKLDAFGDPVKDMKPADISTEKLINSYVSAMTQTSNPKKLKKKLKSVKSVVKTYEMSSPAIPMKITMTDAYVAPNKEAMKIEAQGMVFQSSYYTGSAGASTNMQTGKKELTAEELASKKKREGLIPEMNYLKSGVVCTIKGIEVIDGKEYYVMNSFDGKDDQIDYFDKVTFMKYKTIQFAKTDEGVQESTLQFSEYKDVNGVLFAHKIIQSAGGMTFNVTVKEIIVNGKVDESLFK
jgi:predicted Zn-dependent peptidase